LVKANPSPQEGIKRVIWQAGNNDRAFCRTQERSKEGGKWPNYVDRPARGWRFKEIQSRPGPEKPEEAV